MVVDVDPVPDDEKEKLEPASAIMEWHELYSLAPNSSSALPPLPLVAIRINESHDRDNPPVVFPPANHENLLISSDPSFISKKIPHIQVTNLGNSYSDSESDSDSVTNSNSSATFSPSDSSPSACPPLFPRPVGRPAAGKLGWVEPLADILIAKLKCIGRSIRSSFSFSRGVLLTFRSAAAAAMLVAFLYFRQRRRLREGQENIDRLMGIAKEREEKIKQLLDQISRMNQVLLGLAPPFRGQY